MESLSVMVKWRKRPTPPHRWDYQEHRQSRVTQNICLNRLRKLKSARTNFLWWDHSLTQMFALGKQRIAKGNPVLQSATIPQGPRMNTPSAKYVHASNIQSPAKSVRDTNLH